MLSLFAFILVMVGAINWFCIGLLQFDFVAGLFGSQASIFSRIAYVAVGISAIIILFNLIKNKGKVVFNLSKIKAKFSKKKEEAKVTQSQPETTPATAKNGAMESGADMGNPNIQNQSTSTENFQSPTSQMESSNDMAYPKSNAPSTQAIRNNDNHTNEY